MSATTVGRRVFLEVSGDRSAPLRATLHVIGSGGRPSRPDVLVRDEGKAAAQLHTGAIDGGVPARDVEAPGSNQRAPGRTFVAGLS
jgi:hypothetical protein